MLNIILNHLTIYKYISYIFLVPLFLVLFFCPIGQFLDRILLNNLFLKKKFNLFIYIVLGNGLIYLILSILNKYNFLLFFLLIFLWVISVLVIKKKNVLLNNFNIKLILVIFALTILSQLTSPNIKPLLNNLSDYWQYLTYINNNLINGSLVNEVNSFNSKFHAKPFNSLLSFYSIVIYFFDLNEIFFLESISIYFYFIFFGIFLFISFDLLKSENVSYLFLAFLVLIVAINIYSALNKYIFYPRDILFFILSPLSIYFLFKAYHFKENNYFLASLYLFIFYLNTHLGIYFSTLIIIITFLIYDFESSKKFITFNKILIFFTIAYSCLFLFLKIDKYKEFFDFNIYQKYSNQIININFDFFLFIKKTFTLNLDLIYFKEYQYIFTILSILALFVFIFFFIKDDNKIFIKYIKLNFLLNSVIFVFLIISFFDFFGIYSFPHFVIERNIYLNQFNYLIIPIIFILFFSLLNKKYFSLNFNSLFIRFLILLFLLPVLGFKNYVEIPYFFKNIKIQNELYLTKKYINKNLQNSMLYVDKTINNSLIAMIPNQVINATRPFFQDTKYYIDPIKFLNENQDFKRNLYFVTKKINKDYQENIIYQNNVYKIIKVNNLFEIN